MTSLAELGYKFDENGVLKTIKDNSPFKFTTQEEYEELGEAVTEEVYRLLEQESGLVRIPLKPPGLSKDEEKEEDANFSFIFVSKNFEKQEKLLVLVHGSGVVRAGQWARRLIINNDLKCGTQMEYIRRAVENGWGVVVMNTNENSSQDEELKYSSTPVQHAQNVWKFFVEKSEAEKIFIVAHSRGGYDTSSVLKKYGGDERISAICLTDSPYFDFPKICQNRENPLIVVNFLAHGKSTSYKICNFRNCHVADLWAGTQVHEWSSHSAIDAVFHIFENDINPDNYLEVMKKAKELVGKEKEEMEPVQKKKRVD